MHAFRIQCNLNASYGKELKVYHSHEQFIYPNVSRGTIENNVTTRYFCDFISN